ncbi:MAG TPA: M20/M25/M40 family metallo-hydrolase, partial [Casimicrobiaceae bacterium]|nr:M20/M25/M40 family metallo-hydrolase [Casimicrobiaceae bacterium]
TERVRGERLPPEEQWLEEFMLPGYDRNRLGFQRVARRKGNGRGRALLLGDLDTAFVPGKGFPFRIEGDKAYGPGIADMKGGLTVAVFALEALQATGLDNLAQVTCVFSSDEQAGSLDARKPIEQAARDADWVFCVECARDGGNIMGSRAQIGVAKLEVFGRDAHAGSAYAKGVSAIEAMARKITAIHALTDPAREIFLCVGQVNGGWRRSVIAGYCSATVDIRTPGPEAWVEVEGALRRIADKVELPGSSAKILIASHRPGVPWTAKTDRLIAIAKEAGKPIGVQFGVMRSPAAGSSAFVGPLGMPCLDGMGPLGGDLMTDHEHIVVSSLVDRAALLAATMHDLGAGAWDAQRNG